MRKNKILQGSLFIILAIAILLTQFYPALQLNLWSTIGLVVLGGLTLQQLFDLEFVGAGIFLATFLTVLSKVYEPWYYLVGLPYISTGVLYLFLILLGVGLNLIFKETRHKWRRNRWWKKGCGKKTFYYDSTNDEPEDVFDYVEGEFTEMEDDLSETEKAFRREQRKKERDQRRYERNERTYDKNQYQNNGEQKSTFSGSFEQSGSTEDFIKASASFGSINKFVSSRNFTGGDIDCAFGDININLGQSSLSPNGAHLHISCSFGNVKIYIPKSWSVRTDISQAMGTLNDDRAGFNDNTHPQLVITGDVAMGAVNILYV